MSQENVEIVRSLIDSWKSITEQWPRGDALDEISSERSTPTWSG